MIEKNLLPNPEGLITFATYKASQSIVNLINTNFINSGFNLQHMHWGILYRLYKNGNQSAKSLAEKCLMPDHILEKVTGELIEKQLILLKDSAFYITTKGELLVPQVANVMLKSLEFLRDGIAPEDLITTINVLNKISHKINPSEELYQLTTPARYIEVEN